MDLCSALANVDVPVFAVCKEVEKDEQVPKEKMLGLEEFKSQYFCGELYHDPDRAFFDALGNKPIFTFGTLGKALLNPLTTRRELKEMGERQTAKGIEGNMVGDGLAKGGVLVVSAGSQLLHVFHEDPGNGIPAAEAAKIVAAVESMRATAPAA